MRMLKIWYWKGFKKEHSYIHNAIVKVQPKKGCSHSGVISNSFRNKAPNNHRQKGAGPIVKSDIELAMNYRVHLNKGKEKQEQIERKGEVAMDFVMSHSFWCE